MVAKVGDWMGDCLLFTVLISVRDWSRGLASLVAPATITEIVPPWSLRSLRELGTRSAQFFSLYLWTRIEVRMMASEVSLQVLVRCCPWSEQVRVLGQ